MSEKVRHHFNPQLSLRRFRDRSLEGYDIWEYRKGKAPKPVLIEKAAMQEHYNTIILAESGNQDSTLVENALARYESEAGEVLKTIEEGKRISPQQKLKISEFLSLQLTRPPIFRAWVVEKWKQLYGIELSSDVALGYLDTKHSHFFYDVKWETLTAPQDASFVTSDNPLSIHNHRDPGWSSFAGWLYPLSPRIALASSADEDRERHLNRNNVNQINLWIIQAAHQFVYASEKSDIVDHMVQKYINTNLYLV